MFVALYKWFMNIISEEKGLRIALSILSLIIFISPGSWDFSRTVNLAEDTETEDIFYFIFYRALPLITLLTAGGAAGAALGFRTYMPIVILFVLGTVKLIAMRQFIEFGVYFAAAGILIFIFAQVRKKGIENDKNAYENKQFTEIKNEVIYRAPDKMPKEYDSRFDDF